jgi:hypothetical protein
MNTRPQPVPADWSGLQGRDEYIHENGFSIAGYAETKSKVNVAGIDLTIPNPPKRRYIIKVHDLHHVITGYGTDLVGEGEVSFWELRAGTRVVGSYVLLLIVISAILGTFIAPGRMLRAWRASKGARGLWSSPFSYEQMMEASVGDLRTYAGIPRDGLAKEPRRLHKRAPIEAATAVS